MKKKVTLPKFHFGERIGFGQKRGLKTDFHQKNHPWTSWTYAQVYIEIGTVYGEIRLLRSRWFRATDGNPVCYVKQFFSTGSKIVWCSLWKLMTKTNSLCREMISAKMHTLRTSFIQLFFTISSVYILDQVYDMVYSCMNL